MPKKGKHGKAEEMAAKFGKGVEKAGQHVDKGLHKGWDVTKGAAKDVGKHLEEAGEEAEEEVKKED